MNSPFLQEIVELLGPTGPFANGLPGFEWRPSQQEMAISVGHVLIEGGVVLAEAGTGTGKSLAYLVPAALHALQTGEKVVISTNTINLQEQLIYKDIPLVQQLLAPNLQACLVKGWHNYVCLYRLLSLQRMANTLPGMPSNDDLAKLSDWAKESNTGSLSEWPIEPTIWDEVCAESDTCLRKDCPYVERCFLFAARAKVAAAHVLVVNHHLLLADVAVRRSIGYDAEQAVLPAYQHLIVDEAHHLDKVASDFLGDGISEYSLRMLVNRLNRAGGRSLLPLVTLLVTGQNNSAAAQVQQVVVDVCHPALNTLESARHAFFSATRSWLHRVGCQRGSRRIRPGAEQEQWYKEVNSSATQLSTALEQMKKALNTLRKKAEPLLDTEKGVLRELEAVANRCQEQAELADYLGKANDENQVFWAEYSGRRQQVRVAVTPLDVGPAVAEWLSSLQAVAFTSATLTVARSFGYVSKNLGLSSLNHSKHEVIIPSPFNFREQALVAVPTDMPEPNHPTYPDALAAAVSKLVVSSRGRAFVLFTSYQLLQHVARVITPLCTAEDWPLLVQGEEGRTQMLNAFREGNSVLLGTDSFWEGVDVPGEALSCVILTRLPFRVPDDPVVEARTQALASKGIDPFYNYAMPEAVLKFKQGFGRLIRSKQDKGAVVVCDRRILQRSYGRYFLSSLPECASFHGPLTEVCSAIHEWV